MDLTISNEYPEFINNDAKGKRYSSLYLYDTFLKPFNQKKTEMLFFFTVDKDRCIIGGYIGSIGNEQQGTVSVSSILRQAVIDNAVSLIVAHNHPKGTNDTSEGDYNFYSILSTNAGLLNIKISEYIIFNETGYSCESELPEEPQKKHSKKDIVILVIRDLAALCKGVGTILICVALMFLYIQVNYGASAVKADYFLWFFFYPIGWILELVANGISNLRR